jgi:hypothetical protein
LRTLAFLSALVSSLGTYEAHADDAPVMVNTIDLTPFHAPNEVVDFVLAIAGPTATAAGDRSDDRVVTIGRNDKNELVVTSIQLAPAGQAPNFPAGTVAAMIVRHAGECQPPHGTPDDAALEKRIYSFFVDYRGKTVWELSFQNGLASFRAVQSADGAGPDETFNMDPAKYKTYTCAKYE